MTTALGQHQRAAIHIKATAVRIEFAQAAAGGGVFVVKVKFAKGVAPYWRSKVEGAEKESPASRKARPFCQQLAFLVGLEYPSIQFGRIAIFNENIPIHKNT